MGLHIVKNICFTKSQPLWEKYLAHISTTPFETSEKATPISLFNSENFGPLFITKILFVKIEIIPSLASLSENDHFNSIRLTAEHDIS